jgi:hypothetical protein
MHTEAAPEGMGITPNTSLSLQPFQHSLNTTFGDFKAIMTPEPLLD